MVHSTLDNWDGSLSGSGETNNKRQSSSTSLPPTSLESAAEQNLPVQLEALIIPDETDLSLSADTRVTRMHASVDVNSTLKPRLFVPTGLLVDLPTNSKTMARVTAQDRANTATMIIPHDLHASNDDFLQLQANDHTMHVDSISGHKDSTARSSRQAQPIRQPHFVPGLSSPSSLADNVSTPRGSLFRPSPSPGHNYRSISSPSKFMQDIFTPSPPPSQRARPTQIAINHRSGPRFIIDYIAVPPLPHGLEKADYTKPRAQKAFAKKPAAKILTVKKPFLKQSQIHHHPSLVDVLSRAASHNALPAYSRKGKERVIDSEPDSDPDYEDGSTIHVSRPLKRKEKVLDRDATGSMSVVSPPKKKRKPQADKSNDIASTSSYAPSDTPSASTRHAKLRPRGNPRRDATTSPSKAPQITRRMPRDARLPKCDIEPQEAYELDAYPRACDVSLRHIRAVFEESGGRAKLWAARYDVGDERVYTRHAPVPPPASAHSPPKARKKPGPKPKLRGPTFDGAAPSMRSTNASAFDHKSNKESQHSGIMRNEKGLPIAGTSSNIGASRVAAMVLDYSSTSADAEGETDLEYFNELIGNPLGKDGAARSPNISSHVATPLASSFVDASNRLEISQSEMSHTSSATLPPASSYSTCSSEEPVHNEYFADFTMDGSQADSQVLPQGAELFTASSPLAENEISPWLTENLAYAGNGTIDPSLLGGAQLIPNSTPSPSPGPMHFQEINITEAPHDSPNSPMPDHQDFLPTLLAQPASPVDLPKRTRRRTVRADMVPIDSVLSGSDSSSDSDTSVQSSADLQYPASDAGTASHEIASAGPSFDYAVYNSPTSTSSTSSQDTSRPPHGPSTVQEKPVQNIDISLERYCHQCRRQTRRPKMKCMGKTTNSRGAPCKLEYCDHCVGQRYPQLKFDKTNAEFACPRCSGYCNCTHCSRKRGEVYEGPRTAQTSSNVQRLDKTQPPAKNVRNFPSAPVNPTRYWGTVYDSVTGEKISAAYVGSDDEDPRVVMSRFISTKGALSARVHGQHAFVGKVQDSWRVNYRKVKGGTRGRATGRVYVGRKPPTQRPVWVDDDAECEGDFDRPRSSSPISDAESDLTSLPDTPPHWLEPEEGESLSYGLTPEINEEVTKKALEALLGSIPPPP